MCKAEDPSLKTVFKASLNHNELKDKNNKFVKTKSGKLMKQPIKKQNMQKILNNNYLLIKYNFISKLLSKILKCLAAKFE